MEDSHRLPSPPSVFTMGGVEIRALVIGGWVGLIEAAFSPVWTEARWCNPCDRRESLTASICAK